MTDPEAFRQIIAELAKRGLEIVVETGRSEVQRFDEGTFTRYRMTTTERVVIREIGREA